MRDIGEVMKNVFVVVTNHMDRNVPLNCNPEFDVPPSAHESLGWVREENESICGLYILYILNGVLSIIFGRHVG